MPELVIKRGDTFTQIRVQLQRKDGSFVNFSDEGLSLANIKFHFKQGSTVQSEIATSIDDNDTGKCACRPTLAVIDAVGTIECEVELTHAGGLKETFPVLDKLVIRVRQDLA